MPIPNTKYKGQILVIYGACSSLGKYTQKDLDDIDILDYYNYNQFDDLEDCEKVDCELDGNILNLNGYLYTYIKDDDIFMSLNLDTYNTLVKILAIYNKCQCCNNEDYLIPYCYSKKWICNSCILDNIEYHKLSKMIK